MSGQEKIVAELIRGLKHERDEIKLQLHLAKKELQEDWEQLDDRLNQLDNRFKPARKAASESAEDVWESLKFVGLEIRDGFKRIRDAI